MEVDLSEKIALVCGGTSGIGKAAAKVLAKKNCHVIIASPNQEKVQASQLTKFTHIMKN